MPVCSVDCWLSCSAKNSRTQEHILWLLTFVVDFHLQCGRRQVFQTKNCSNFANFWNFFLKFDKKKGLTCPIRLWSASSWQIENNKRKVQGDRPGKITLSLFVPSCPFCTLASSLARRISWAKIQASLDTAFPFAKPIIQQRSALDIDIQGSFFCFLYKINSCSSRKIIYYIFAVDIFLFWRVWTIN